MATNAKKKPKPWMVMVIDTHRIVGLEDLSGGPWEVRDHETAVSLTTYLSRLGITTQRYSKGYYPEFAADGSIK